MRLKLKAENGGRLISRGRGKHISRVITSWELIFVLKSELAMFVGKDNYTIPAEHCLLIPPGVLHGGRNSYSPELSFYWVHFQGAEKEDKELLEKLPHFFPIANASRLSEYFHCFLALQEENFEDKEGLDLLVELIFHEAFQKNIPESEVTGMPPLVHQLKKILSLRFREPLSTSLLARELSCNPDYLGRIWSQHFHESITDSLNNIRIRHAADLLRYSSFNIDQVAYEVGFNDCAYFRRRFFRIHAMSPRIYRKLWMKEHVNTE